MSERQEARVRMARPFPVERLRTVTGRFARIEELGILIALVCLGGVLALTTGTFLRTDNLLQVARQASYYGIMAVGMVFVLTIGDVDLSVGSIMMLTNVVVALALRERIPEPLSVLLGLGVGLACGLANGALSVALRIPMIIVTLGTMNIYRGFTLVLSNASPITEFPTNTPLFSIGGGTLAGVPTGAIVMLAIGIGGHLLYTRTIFGRRIQAIGSNPEAARFVGIRIPRYRILVMALSGLTASVAGITALAYLQGGHPNTGLGSELFVIASAIIGGTALTGGSGSVLGAILGALIIAVIWNGLALLGVSAYWATAVTGTIIVAAVALDYLIKRREGR